MKKTLIIALAGMMLFAFTQCGGGNGGGSKATKGSKEYQDNMELFNKLEKAITDTKTCDELQEAALGVLLVGLANTQTYSDEEKMTETEKAEIDKLGEKVEEVLEKQAKKLGCDDD